MAEHNELGKWGEDYATIWLRDKGYVIVERDWHSKHRDIDIIALDGNTMVFRLLSRETRQRQTFYCPLPPLSPYHPAVTFRLDHHHQIEQ